jgi:hypothetical protein
VPSADLAVHRRLGRATGSAEQGVRDTDRRTAPVRPVQGVRLLRLERHGLLVALLGPALGVGRVLVLLRRGLLQVLVHPLLVSVDGRLLRVGRRRRGHGVLVHLALVRHLLPRALGLRDRLAGTGRPAPLKWSSPSFECSRLYSASDLSLASFAPRTFSLSSSWCSAFVFSSSDGSAGPAAAAFLP